MNITELSAFRLKPWFSERVWGKRDLRPWYADTGTTELVGEAWLTGPQCVVETGPFAGETLTKVGENISGEFPLLVKILFPAEKLSVQVHPDDAQARTMGETRGKTECWYVLESEPGATVALGLKEGVGAAEVLASVSDGTMESLLQHVPVEVGDMLFVDAGTVHAIGPGVVLLETQQTSDVTYRLYDYGRPRELHLEKGLAVMKTHTKAGKVVPRAIGCFTRLIEEQYFVVDRYDIAAGGSASLENLSAGCVVGLNGVGAIDGVEVRPGQAVVLLKGAAKVESVGGLTFMWCWEPPHS